MPHRHSIPPPLLGLLFLVVSCARSQSTDRDKTAGGSSSPTTLSTQAPKPDTQSLEFTPQKLSLSYGDETRRRQTLWFSGREVTQMKLKAITLEGHPRASRFIALRPLRTLDQATGEIRLGVELELDREGAAEPGQAKLVIATGLQEPLRVVVDVTWGP